MDILVIEDDKRIASLLQRGLTAEGHHVAVEYDGRDGLERARSEPFDLLILDRMLPYVDGVEICRVLREEHRPVSIVMLTARDSLEDKISGLRGGADDYMTKPFAFDELLARIVALQRRDHRRQKRTVSSTRPSICSTSVTFVGWSRSSGARHCSANRRRMPGSTTQRATRSWSSTSSRSTSVTITTPSSPAIAVWTPGPVRRIHGRTLA